MLKVESSVDIKRPVEDVFAYVADPSNVAEWSSIYFEAKLEGSGPMRVGSRIKSASRFLGRRIDMTGEVTEYERNRKFSIRADSGPAHGSTVYRLEPTEQGTRLHFKMEGEAPGLFKLADPVLSGLVKRHYDADLASLKELLEAQIQVGGGRR